MLKQPSINVGADFETRPNGGMAGWKIRAGFQTRPYAALLALLLFAGGAFADTEGPRSPTASANDAWTNSANMNAQDGTSATGNYLAAVDKITFGFSTVTGTVNGVLVEIDEHKTGTRANTLDVNLLNAGTCTLKTVTMDTTDDSTYDSLGGAADTWSCTALTAAAVNNSAFGVHITASKSGGASPVDSSYNVDHVRITVTFTPAGTRNRVSVSSRLEWPKTAKE